MSTTLPSRGPASPTPDTPAAGPDPNAPPLDVETRLQHVWRLLGLWSFVVAQPTFVQWIRHPNFLKDMGIAYERLWAVVLCMALVFPLAAACVPLLAGLVSRSAGRWLFRSMDALLVATFCLPFFKVWPMSVGILLSLLAGSGLVWGTLRNGRLRQFLSVASFGTLIFPALFLTHPAIQPLIVLPRTAPAVTQPVSNPVPVVMVMFDEFPANALWNEQREIDATLFPNLARFSEQSFWYRNATSVHYQTGVALPAILSGTYPSASADEPFVPQSTLFTKLIDEHGYDGLVLEPVTRECTSKRLVEISGPISETARWQQFWSISSLAYGWQILPADLTGSLPSLPLVWFGVYDQVIDTSATRGIARHHWSRNRDQQLRHFLHGIIESDTPTLYFLHVVLPHVHYLFDGSGTSYVNGSNWDFRRPADMAATGSPLVDADRYPRDPLFIAQSRQRMIWQIQYVDRFVGELVSRLRQNGLYDKCLLVVAADHGVSIRPGEHRRVLTEANHLDITSVPLFIKPPGLEKGRAIDDPVETIDILPTIYDVLQPTDTPLMDGQSLLQPHRPRRSKRFVNVSTLHVLPADYPRNVPRTDWPPLSKDADRIAAELADPQQMTGHRVDEYESTNPSTCRIDWLPGALPERIATAGATVYLPGQVSFPIPTDQTTRLALAFDGVIVAVTRTFEEPPERDAFQFLVPPARHPAAVNRMEIYVVNDRGEAPPTLSRCESIHRYAPKDE